MNVGVREKDICSEKPQQELNLKSKTYTLAFTEKENIKFNLKKIR